MAQFDNPKLFPQFMKLPVEVRHMIFEAMADEPRVVPVHSVSSGGFRSWPPPVLHLCSEARIIGLKHYSLAFSASRPQSSRAGDAEEGLSPGAYFNFERDTLYLGEGWNRFVKDGLSCLSHIGPFIQDLERVKKLGIHVDAKVCGGSGSVHSPGLGHWVALQTLYIGSENGGLTADCPVTMRGLESKEEYTDFKIRYNLNPGWKILPGDAADDAEAIRCLSSRGANRYRGGAGGFIELEPVYIDHL